MSSMGPEQPPVILGEFMVILPMTLCGYTVIPSMPTPAACEAGHFDILQQIKMLSERKRELELRVDAALEENELLQATVDNLQERTLVLESQCHEKDLQLRQSQVELHEVRLSHRQLTSRLEELTEERSLQGLVSQPVSLLCEIEQSMEQEELEQEREQFSP